MLISNASLTQMVVSPPKKWVAPPAELPQEAVVLSGKLNISPLLCKLLIDRGVDTFEEAKTYFRPSLSMLHDPFLMQDMRQAVDRLRKALEEEERICVYGDYDVDGTTAVAMMFDFLNEVGAQVDHYQPDRYEEGYGLSKLGVERARERKVSLMITLDCGVKATEQIAHAKSLGIDVIVCDHHNPDEQLPEASAILNPKRSDCNYPDKGLSGCGVGFKLIQAFVMDMGWDEEVLLSYLDLLVISIGADIVPMTGENRVMAHFGLRTIDGKARPGLNATFKRAGNGKTAVNISDVVFTVAPRINAAGRIGHAELAVRLLLAKTEEEAETLSIELEKSNLERKDLDKQITIEAEQQVRANSQENDHSTVVWGEDWHKGVVGIVASRLIERFYRPTVVLSKVGDIATGSVRSIPGIDVYQLLGKCSHLLEQYGGHAMAAGLHIKSENLTAFHNAFEEAVATATADMVVEERIEISAELRFEDITTGFYKILKQFAPFGPGNMRPVFLTRGVVNAGYTKKVGADQTHLKVHLMQGAGSSPQFWGIGFGMAEHADELMSGTTFDVVYCLEENEWNGKRSLQLNIKDLRPAAAS